MFGGSLLFGFSMKEHFLKLLGSVMNDIEYNFIDIVSAERILLWRVAVQDLIKVGFVVEFLLYHLREIDWAFFMKKVQLVVDDIDTRIKVADLEVGCECLLSGVIGSSHFEDQTLISGL